MLELHQRVGVENVVMMQIVVLERMPSWVVVKRVTQCLLLYDWLLLPYWYV